jgi:hypothetical protein
MIQIVYNWLFNDEPFWQNKKFYKKLFEIEILKNVSFYSQNEILSTYFLDKEKLCELLLTK